jgi:methionyl-tRNA formyltransferase
VLRIVFMGSPAFAARSLEALIDAHDVALVVTQPDKPRGRGKKLAAPAVKELAAARGLPVIQPASARKADPESGLTLGGRLRQLEADVGIVVAYGKILPREVLEAFPHGCLNVHASLLPRYRGAAPIQRAIIAGERETGVSIMRLDEGMDTGPVLGASRVAIEPDETSGELMDRLAGVGAEALLESLVALEAGRLREMAQDEAAATCAPMLEKGDGAIDWSEPAEAVRNRIRGVDPWPGARSRLDDLDLKLFSAYRADGAGEPGEVIEVGARGLVLACGDGAVGVAEVQAAGRKRMSATDFARGRGLEVGARLSSLADRGDG